MFNRYATLVTAQTTRLISARQTVIPSQFGGGSSGFTLIRTPHLVKVTCAKPSNFLITYSGSSVVRHFRCGQLFIVETVHGAQSTFCVITVTFFPRGAHWATSDG